MSKEAYIDINDMKALVDEVDTGWNQLNKQYILNKKSQNKDCLSSAQPNATTSISGGF